MREERERKGEKRDGFLKGGRKRDGTEEGRGEGVRGMEQRKEEGMEHEERQRQEVCVCVIERV